MSRYKIVGGIQWHLSSLGVAIEEQNLEAVRKHLYYINERMNTKDPFKCGDEDCDGFYKGKEIVNDTTDELCFQCLGEYYTF